MTPRQLNRLEQEIELRLLRRDVQPKLTRIRELERIVAPGPAHGDVWPRCSFWDYPCTPSEPGDAA